MGFKCFIMGYDISDFACNNCSLKCKLNRKIERDENELEN